MFKTVKLAAVVLRNSNDLIRRTVAESETLPDWFVKHAVLNNSASLITEAIKKDACSDKILEQVAMSDVYHRPRSYAVRKISNPDILSRVLDSSSTPLSVKIEAVSNRNISRGAVLQHTGEAMASLLTKLSAPLRMSTSTPITFLGALLSSEALTDSEVSAYTEEMIAALIKKHEEDHRFTLNRSECLMFVNSERIKTYHTLTLFHKLGMWEELARRAISGSEWFLNFCKKHLHTYAHNPEGLPASYIIKLAEQSILNEAEMLTTVNQ